ncbi:NUDIX hydrolase [Spirulina sp. CS-785/01]|uniref:NUDIX hydrolase n=1 Tax=Spirulina sp. CS-785/01 TaxID=3021716 RepID=UPI00232B8286|nr:NUDIX hydrolase [Spirulina sp. CS-785/01]MDB9314402.1 NUDIX hydrolase [Spirulina sp. CS-785/01]
MSQLKKWQLLDSQFIVDHRWCRVRRDTVELPDGTVIDDYFVHVRPEIVYILPITCDRKVVFVRQYRHGVQDIFLELPAGAFNPQQEDGESAAKRELAEETGYTSPHWEKLTTFFHSPVKDTSKIHLFLARDVEPTQPQTLDLTEDIEVVLIPLSDIPQKIHTGDINVSGTIAALFWGLQYVEFH